MFFRRHKKKNKYKQLTFDMEDEFVGRWGPDDEPAPLSRKQLKKLKKAEKAKLSEKQREAAVYALKTRVRVCVTIHKTFK